MSGPALATPTLLERTIGDVLAELVRTEPDRIFLTAGGAEYSYAQLWQQSSSVATALLAKGIRRGDRVTTWMPNGAEWIVSAFALARIGAINVLVNARFRPREVTDLVRRSGSKGLIGAVVDSPELVVGYDNSLEWSIAVDGGDRTSQPWAKVAATKADPELLHRRAAEVRAEDPIYAIYTSGTTGPSKGSLTRHGAALQNAYNSGERMGFTADDRLLCFLPMSHCFGAVNALLNSLTHGCRFDLEADFDAESVLGMIADRGVTAIYGVPTHYTLLAEAQRASGRPRDVSSLVRGCIGGGVVCPDLARAISAELDIPDLVHAYGMTESTAVISQARCGDPEYERLQTAGTAMPGVEIRLVDTDGRSVPPGEPGQIWIRGFNVHAGYLGMAEDPSARPGNWWDTGDIGSLDGGGRLRLRGRSKEMYKCSGFNVYPLEVEAYLNLHPDIAESAVVGIPHPTKLETGVAFVIAAPGAQPVPEQLTEYVRGGLAGYKVPDRVFVVADFPRSAATSKVQKHILHKQAIESIGRERNSSEL